MKPGPSPGGGGQFCWAETLSFNIENVYFAAIPVDTIFDGKPVKFNLA